MIVLDTHALLWWINGDVSHFSPAGQHALAASLDQCEIFVSAFSAWEIAMLVRYDRLKLGLDVPIWWDKVAAIPGVRIVDVSPAIAIASTMLPGTFHKDPADRLIVATARHLSAPLLTLDAKIRDYPHVRVIW